MAYKINAVVEKIKEKKKKFALNYWFTVTQYGLVIIQNLLINERVESTTN